MEGDENRGKLTYSDRNNLLQLKRQITLKFIPFITIGSAQQGTGETVLRAWVQKGYMTNDMIKRGNKDQRGEQTRRKQGN